MQWRRRCNYIDSLGLQCETWFILEVGNSSYLCAAHDNLITPSRAAANGDIKVKYIDLVNSQRAECNKMSIPELQDHVAKVEQALELAKINANTSNAVLREKLSELSEEKRRELRKIKISDAVPANNDRTRTRTPKIEQDPVSYMMAKYRLNRAQAEARIKIMQR